MWNSSQGGGFMNNLSSPSAQGNSGGGKAKRAQNLVPVMINEILSAPEEGFSVEGIEVGLVAILGEVISVEKATTKTTYQVQDSTGGLEVVQWIEEGAAEPEFSQGAYIKAHGAIRTQGEKKHLMAFRIMEAPSQEEKDCHALQVVYSHLKLKQINAKMSGQGSMDTSGLSNSMMGSGLGSNFGGGSMMSSSSASFGNKNYDTVYNLIKQTVDEHGINTSTIFSSVQGKMSKQEMDGAIEFLSNEGHIYSTIDDEHFKSTDGD
eukprot:TRINITY_DN5453_c0_g1_i1.p1 TRINITY_DN5453_c0_g1~~TRINITY_DN5453_c0_g1_i1.p1  ORF type:complete len:263 (+),score=100.36 TRINITY_DN5453_c0_g1_i1:12-800(+)